MPQKLWVKARSPMGSLQRSPDLQTGEEGVRCPLPQKSHPQRSSLCMRALGFDPSGRNDPHCFFNKLNTAGE